jgi:hypothetical protein
MFFSFERRNADTARQNASASSAFVSAARAGSQCTGASPFFHWRFIWLIFAADPGASYQTLG